MKDRELWDRLRAGREDALERIYRDHIDFLLRYGHGLSADQALVEDCIHDLFVSIWNNREGLGPNDAIRPYLLVSLRRKIIREQKRQQARLSIDPSEIPGFDIDPSMVDPGGSQENHEEHLAKTKAALQQLSKRQREALYLKYFENLSYEEICEVMGINYQSVRNLVHTGINTLRKVLVWVVGVWLVVGG